GFAGVLVLVVPTHPPVILHRRGVFVALAQAVTRSVAGDAQIVGAHPAHAFDCLHLRPHVVAGAALWSRRQNFDALAVADARLNRSVDRGFAHVQPGDTDYRSDDV